MIVDAHCGVRGARGGDGGDGSAPPRLLPVSGQDGATGFTLFQIHTMNMYIYIYEYIYIYTYLNVPTDEGERGGERFPSGVSALSMAGTWTHLGKSGRVQPTDGWA